MKKTALALALLNGFVGAAYAQSPVTVYGQIDLSLSAVSTGAASNAKSVRMNPGSASPSLLGFRGSEDLGGGMSALFGLEMVMAPDTGGAGNPMALSGTSDPVSTLFNRQAFVGLKSEFGTVKLGRDYTPAIIASIPASVIASGVSTGLMTVTTAQGITNDYFNSNQVSYESPRVGGVGFRANYALGEVAGSVAKGASVGGMVDYKNGPLTLAAGLQRNNDRAGQHVDWWVLAGAYSFDAFKITFGFDRVKSSAGVVGPVAFPWRDSSMATIGASYRLNQQVEFSGQHYRVKDDVSGAATKQSILNVDYSLSKRTSLYAIASFVQNGTIAISPIYSGAASVPNSNARGMALGIRHRF